jgi:hypothetical protein
MLSVGNALSDDPASHPHSPSRRPPVIWCTPGGGHTDGGGSYPGVISAFWASLPAVP